MVGMGNEIAREAASTRYHAPPGCPADARRWPARHSCPVPRLCYLEIVQANDVLDDIVACCVPDIDAERRNEIGPGLHGQVRLDSSWPAMLWRRVPRRL
jgi:hypothetical protein